MSYFQARSDLQFIKEFRTAVLRLWEIEAKVAEKLRGHYRLLPSEYQAALQSEASKIEGYQQARERVARGVLRAIRIARRLGVPIDVESFPAPAVGGPVVSVNLFYAILRDTSHGGVDRQWIYDALNQTLGEAEAYVSVEFRRLVNPIYWIREVLVFIIRIPFMLIAASGFDVSKVEDHFLAKAFKLLEIVAIIYILVRLGIGKEQLQQVLMTLLSK